MRQQKLLSSKILCKQFIIVFELCNVNLQAFSLTYDRLDVSHLNFFKINQNKQVWNQ